MGSTFIKDSADVSPPFLEGGGKMGELIRSKDWKNTPIGDPQDWPQSLKTMVAVVLNNPFGKYIAWGKDYIQIYNDAYRPVLGKNKHPEALGGQSKNTYAEVWDFIGPLFDKVMLGEGVQFSDYELQLDRNGYTETCYFDFSYAPIFVDNGVVGGVLATVIETTDRKKAELELKEINTQLAFAIEATELGTFDYNPVTNTFSANDRLKGWFGLPKDTEIKLDHGYAAMIPEDRERVQNAINNALDYNSGGSYNIVYTIVNLKSGKRRIVKAKGKTWFNASGVALRFNGTVQDITESELNARQLVTNERQLRLVIEQAPVAISIFAGSQFVIEMANALSLELWGRKESEVLGLSLWAAMPELISQGIPKLIESVYYTQKPYRVTEKAVRLLRNGKIETRYVNFSFEPLYDSDNMVRGVISMGIDVTDQVLSNIRTQESAQRVKSVIENAPFPIGVYIGPEMRIELANQSIIDAWGKGDDVIGKSYKSILPELEAQGVFSQLDRVYRDGETFSTRNQRVDIKVDDHLKTFFFNYELTPLYDTKGKIYGVMNTAADVTDMNLVNIKLEESEKRFRESVKQAPLGIAILRGDDHIFELANETYLQIVNREEDELLNKPLFEVIPEVRDVVEPIFAEIYSGGKPFHSSSLPVYLKRNGVEQLSIFNLTYHPLIETNNLVSGIMVVATEVTEAVNAQKALEESETHFRSLVKESPVAMAVLRGVDYIIEMANAKMLETFWKKTPEEINGKSILTVFPELNDQKHVELFAKVLNDGQKQSETESTITFKNGDLFSKFYVDFDYAPLIDNSGQISGIIITLNDVTAKVEARKLLENAEERVRIATEATKLATWELFLKEKRLIHSPRMAEIFGHPSDYLLTHEFLRSQILKEDVELVVDEAFKEALKSGIYKYQARILKPDKTLAWIDVEGKVFFDDTGEAINTIGTVRDITEEMQYQKALEDSEQKFRTLADAMPQFVWTGDKDGNLNYFNNSVYEYSGNSPEELLNGGWINLVHPDDRARNIEVWEKSMKTGNDFLFEHRFLRNDGEYRWQLSRAVAQRDNNGNILMWVGASTDIHEMKESEQEKDFFIGMASHELKTPITSIKGYVQILQSMYGEGEDDFLNNSLNIIERQVVTLTSLISDLLDLSKIKSGSLVLNKSTFLINDFIREFVLEIQQLNSKYSIFYKDVPNLKINADRERLGQVLINFLTNAIKYSPQESDVFVDLKIQGKNMIVAVKDSGIGISKKDQKKIFERFYRVEGKNEKTYPGFGIGLNIAAEIIERHNGSIQVQSEPGKGSVFTFSVPIELN